MFTKPCLSLYLGGLTYNTEQPLYAERDSNLSKLREVAVLISQTAMVYTKVPTLPVISGPA